MKYNFDQVIERRGTCSNKWDNVSKKFPKNPDALPMWVADMDFQCPQEVVDAVVERAKHPIYGYAFRDNEFGEVTAEWMKKRHGWEIDPSWVTFSGGVVPALSVCINAFTNPGDRIIIQTPVYYPFNDVIVNNGRYVCENPLNFTGDRYEIDFEDLEEKAKDRKARMMILCNPHNPVGRVFTKEELIKIGDICQRNGVLVVADEVHSDFIYPGHKHIPFASISPEHAQNSLVIVAPSKTFNLAGMQASAVITANKFLYQNFEMQVTRNRVSSISLFGITAFKAAYKYGEDYLEQLLPYLWSNYEFTRDYLANHCPKLRVLRPEGTYLLWLDCSGLGLDAEGIDDFFVEARVAMDNGIWFGAQAANFMRMNIATPRATLTEILDRICNTYKKRGY